MSARATALLARFGRALVSPTGLLTLGFAALYLATFDSQMGSPDERERFRFAVDLAARGPKALLGSGAACRYPPLLSIVAAFPARLGLWIDGGSQGLWTARLALGVSLVACVALVPLFFAAARALDVPARAAVLATALFGLTNPVWPYSKRFFSEPLTAALVFAAFAGALVFARRGRRGAFVAGLIALALLPLNNMVLVPPTIIAMAAALWLERRSGLKALAAASAGAVALWLAMTLLRHGSLRTGYGRERFTFDLASSLHGLLFGWGRSIFVYAPLLMLSLLGARALWHRSRGAALGLAAGLGLALLAVGSWWCWWGGICWGPRLLLPMLPVASLAAAPLLAERHRWTAPAALLVLLAGLYVQGIGFAFRHDFDIYFWMKPDYSDESKAWFSWEYSSVRRMPRHFREHPWDLSNAFLQLEQRGPSTVDVGTRPVKQVVIVNRGDGLVDPWSISEIFAVLRDGSRVPARELGATLATYNGQDGSAALDANPRTRWSTVRKRLNGDWVRLEFAQPRSDIVRLELEHLPAEREFPYALTARVEGGDGAWQDVPAHAATPLLRWSAWIFALAGAGVVLIGAALARARARRVAADPPVS